MPTDPMPRPLAANEYYDDEDTWRDAMSEFYYDPKLATISFVERVASSALGTCVGVVVLHFVGVV